MSERELRERLKLLRIKLDEPFSYRGKEPAVIERVDAIRREIDDMLAEASQRSETGTVNVGQSDVALAHSAFPHTKQRSEAGTSESLRQWYCSCCGAKFSTELRVIACGVCSSRKISEIVLPTQAGSETPAPRNTQTTPPPSEGRE